MRIFSDEARSFRLSKPNKNDGVRLRPNGTILSMTGIIGLLANTMLDDFGGPCFGLVCFLCVFVGLHIVNLANQFTKIEKLLRQQEEKSRKEGSAK